MMSVSFVKLRPKSNDLDLCLDLTLPASLLPSLAVIMGRVARETNNGSFTSDRFLSLKHGTT